MILRPSWVYLDWEPVVSLRTREEGSGAAMADIVEVLLPLRVGRVKREVVGWGGGWVGRAWTDRRGPLLFVLLVLYQESSSWQEPGSRIPDDWDRDDVVCGTSWAAAVGRGHRASRRVLCVCVRRARGNRRVGYEKEKKRAQPGESP